MTKQHDQATKAEVQTTKLNRLAVPEEEDTEFSAEEAAEAFERSDAVNEYEDEQ